MATGSVGFIGAGRVAKILVGGWARAKSLPGQVAAYDANPAVCESLKVLSPTVVAAQLAEAAGQDIVFLAVHPPVVKDVLPLVQEHLKKDAVLVSLAPKFTVAKISELLGGFARIARVIPNAPSLVGHGYNPVAYAAGLPTDARKHLADLLAPLGDCPEVPEKDLEAYAILSAMGPTYFWPQFYALKELGESFGLTSDAAMRALDKMLWGTVATMKESGLSPAEVQDLIPVKPMAEEAASVAAAYGAKLAGLMEKIRP